MNQKNVAFLRGINVGGHHKVPMADLRKAFESLGFKNIITVLNSGNVIFESGDELPNQLEAVISQHLEDTFGFPIPTIARSARSIQEIYNEKPFEGIDVTKETRLYISLLKQEVITDLELPWKSDDNSFQILQESGLAVLSVLDLSINNTPKAMEILEKSYGKDITTRNWKTIERIIAKL